MSKNVHNLIQNEYEKKQKIAFDNFLLRRDEVYSKIPRIQEIDHHIQLIGVRFNKMILLGTKSEADAASEMHSKISELNTEKEQLLAHYGYVPDYLKLSYQCRQCNDTGFIDTAYGSQKCICYKQQLINHLYNTSNLNLGRNENFDCFNEGYYPNKVDEELYGLKISPQENVLMIKEKCLDFIKNFDDPEEKNLFFTGRTGCGKTFMANCIAESLIRNGKTVLYQSAPSLFETINEYKRRSFKGEDFEDTGFKDIFTANLLIIDDLGTESQSAARYAELLNILNTRQDNNLNYPCKTIISTNISPKQLYEYYDERIASRIIGCFRMFLFVGEDIRKLKKLG